MRRLFLNHAEEKPVCQACSRLQLPCQYGLKLQWGVDADAVDVALSPPLVSNSYTATPHKEDARQYHGKYLTGKHLGAGDNPKSNRPVSPVHFIHFTVEDFRARWERDLTSDSGDFESSSTYGLLTSDCHHSEFVTFDYVDAGSLWQSSPQSISSPYELFSQDTGNTSLDSLETSSLSTISLLATDATLPTSLSESRSPSSSDLFPNTGLYLFNEPSWFPRLELSTSYDEILFTYCVLCRLLSMCLLFCSNCC